MVNLTSKIRQIAVIFVIAWASFCDGQKHLGSETRTQYDRYKLVRMTTTELNGDQSKLYSFLTPSKHNDINVWCIKFRSKHSSNTVLCLLRNLMHQMLRLIYWYVSVQYLNFWTTKMQL